MREGSQKPGTVIGPGGQKGRGVLGNTIGLFLLTELDSEPRQILMRVVRIQSDQPMGGRANAAEPFGLEWGHGPVGRRMIIWLRLDLQLKDCISSLDVRFFDNI